MGHFIWFLNTQIKSSEHSTFCNECVVGDVMSGFKTFVVKFMIRMSKVHVIFIAVLHALKIIVIYARYTIGLLTQACRRRVIVVSLCACTDVISEIT